MGWGGGGGVRGEFGAVGGEGGEAAAGDGLAEARVEHDEDVVVFEAGFLDEAEGAAFEIGEEGFEVEEGRDGVVDVFFAVAAEDDEEVGMLGVGGFLDFVCHGVEIGDGDCGADDEVVGVEFGVDGVGEAADVEGGGGDGGDGEEGEGDAPEPGVRGDAGVFSARAEQEKEPGEEDGEGEPHAGVGVRDGVAGQALCDAFVGEAEEDDGDAGEEGAEGREPEADGEGDGE